MEAPQNLTDYLPKEALYHYSSPGGMLGMLESKSLWMSNIRYQNDAEEYKHAFRVFEEVIKDEYHGFDLEKLLGYTTVIEGFVPSVFTFSLTEEGDLLSQWRGYAPAGGYSFCLDRDMLNALIHRFNLSVYQCVYKETEQKDIIKRVVIQFSPQEWELVHLGKKSMDTPMIYNIKHILSRLAAYAPMLKHHAFKEEKEWRIVKSFEGGGPDNRPIDKHPAFENIRIRPTGTAKHDGDFLRFREDKGMLVPYLSLPLVEDVTDPYQVVKLSEVFVGPGPQQDIAVPACKTLLKGWGAGGPVKPSVAPYRK